VDHATYGKLMVVLCGSCSHCPYDILELWRVANKSTDPSHTCREAIRGLQAIHQLGVLQKDPAGRHILVHPDRPGMTWIDFERAVIFSPRVTLGSLSANRKRKLEFREGAKSPEKSENACAKQMARLVGSTSFRGRAGG
jgi:hypothetical protein